MKIAVFYPFIDSYGGGNRIISVLSRKFDIDLYVGGYKEEIVNDIISKNTYIQVVGKNRVENLFGREVLFMKDILRFRLPKKYDIVNYHNFSSSAISIKVEVPTVYYFNTYERLFYEPFYILNGITYPRKMELFLWSRIGKFLDNMFVKRTTVLVANSLFLKDKIKEIYHRTSEVIYPPIDINKFKFKKIGDFFLVVSRLEKYKRIDIIIDAMRYLPDEKLIVVGDGEYRKILEKNAPKNVTFLGNVEDKYLINLYANCKATIYIPYNEFFGIVPVESMASGKIVIGVNEGGLKETIIDGKTGFFTRPNVNDLINTVKLVSSMDLKKYRHYCRKHAMMFSTDEFVKKMKNLFDFIS